MFLYTAFCRLYQCAFKIASPIFPWREPELLEGPNAVLSLPALIQRKGIQRVLVVTDAGIRKLGLLDPLLAEFKKASIKAVVYDGTKPNPTIGNIDEALVLYKANTCEALVAFGGGSPMDCAKGVGARLARPSRTTQQLRGLLKVGKKLPPLFAVPTTAGTGSEATLAAVITNPDTHEKYPINDHALIPHYAVLDPQLTVGLPPHITATTGMDALTHAIEAYIGNSNTKETRRDAVEATRLIMKHLTNVYAIGTDIEGRGALLKAAYLAGKAFTRAYVGYVHAMAHQLGGFYNTAHGLANSVLLPYVLEYYGQSVWKPLARLSREASLAVEGDSDEATAKAFIERIKMMNATMNIPMYIDSIRTEDIPLLVKRALHEANPLYPVPRILGAKDLTALFLLASGKA